MDIAYPLAYSNGSIALSNSPLSQARHLLDTIAGERALFPEFGVPLDILFSTGIPQILAERIRLTANQLSDVQTQVEIESYENGVLQLKLILANETITASYATS